MQQRSIFLKILAIVTTAEFPVMILLKIVHVPHGIVESVTDAILLSLFSAPFLYFFVILPVARGLADKADLVRKTGEQAKALKGDDVPDLFPGGGCSCGYSANAIHDSFVLHPGIPFLQKPFGPGALARKVREVLDRK